jgi:hypothetical protein
MSLKEHLVVEAAYGVLAEQLDVDIDTAQLILDGCSRRSGRPVREVAGAVIDGSLDLTWADRDAEHPEPDVPHDVLHVLYIEDQENNLVLMRRVFGRWPSMHLDGNLPDIDGAEVLRQIRSDPATADLPIIVVSADASPARVSALIAAGANEYLTKPFDFRHLDRLIKALMTAAVPARHVERS